MMKISNLFQWQRNIGRFFLPYAKPDRNKIIMLAVLALVMTVSNALLIWTIGGAITKITQGQFEQLDMSILLIAVIVLFNQILQFTQAFTMQRVSLHFVNRVRGSLLDKIVRLSFTINRNIEKGDLMARLSTDINKILPFVINAPLNLFTNIVILIVYGSILILVDWQLALIVVAMAPVFYFSQHYVAPKTGLASRHAIEENANLLVIEEQTLSNLRGVSSFNSEKKIHDVHKTQYETQRHWALKALKIRILYNTLFTFLVYFAAVIIVYYGVDRIQSDQMTIGVLISFLMYVRLLALPARNIALIPINLQANRAAADRVIAVMQMQPEVQDQKNSATLDIGRAEINFNVVSFNYPGGVSNSSLNSLLTSSEKVFNNLSIDIHAGETVALVGPSGSGKSTLALLLLRFYDPQQGVISIDGIDIKSVSLASLRQQVSIVWQEPFLINGSIKDNLLLAKPDATDDQIIAACQSGFAWDFIEKLQQGIDTVIGTRGVSLSVGQKQRLAVAQAFLRNTPILILDEATSALDSHSEQKLVEAINKLRNNRTTLIIAHRFSSIRNADRILYFNHKGVITSGTHDELIKTVADYKKAVDWQTSRSNDGFQGL